MLWSKKGRLSTSASSETASRTMFIEFACNAFSKGGAGSRLGAHGARSPAVLVLLVLRGVVGGVVTSGLSVSEKPSVDKEAGCASSSSPKFQQSSMEQRTPGNSIASGGLGRNGGSSYSSDDTLDEYGDHGDARVDGRSGVGAAVEGVKPKS